MTRGAADATETRGGVESTRISFWSSISFSEQLQPDAGGTPRRARRCPRRAFVPEERDRPRAHGPRRQPPTSCRPRPRSRPRRRRPCGRRTRCAPCSYCTCRPGKRARDAHRAQRRQQLQRFGVDERGRRAHEQRRGERGWHVPAQGRTILRTWMLFRNEASLHARRIRIATPTSWTRARSHHAGVIGILSLMAVTVGPWWLLPLLALQLVVGLTLGRRWCLPCLFYFEVLQPASAKGRSRTRARRASATWSARVPDRRLRRLRGRLDTLGLALGAIVAVLALLAAATGFCAGCTAFQLGFQLTGRPFVSCPLPPQPSGGRSWRRRRRPFGRRSGP